MPPGWPQRGGAGCRARGMAEARRRGEPGRFRSCTRSGPHRGRARGAGGGEAAGAHSYLPPRHPGHSGLLAPWSHSHSPTGAHSPAGEPDGCPTGLVTEGQGLHGSWERGALILPGWGGLESENPRRGVLAGSVPWEVGEGRQEQQSLRPGTERVGEVPAEAHAWVWGYF